MQNSLMVNGHTIWTSRSLEGVDINLPLVRFADGTTINMFDGTRSVVGNDDFVIEPPILIDDGPKQTIFFRRQYGGIKTLEIGSIPGAQIEVVVHMSDEVLVTCTGTDKDTAKTIRTMKKDTLLVVDGGTGFDFRTNIERIISESLVVQGMMMAPPVIQMIIYVPEKMEVRARGAWNRVRIGKLSNSVQIQSFGVGDVTIGTCGNARLIQSGRGVLTLEYGIGNLVIRNDSVGDILVHGGSYQALSIGTKSAGRVIVNAPCNTCDISALGLGDIFVKECRSTPTIANPLNANISINP